MTKILFVCHGNICRSPMAEFMLKDMINKQQIEDVEIESAATSSEEIGNDIYGPAKRILREKGVPFERRAARRIRKGDYDYYDYIIGMDQYNIRNMQVFFGADPDKKIRMLLDRPVSDPWFTGDFESTYYDLREGLTDLLNELRQNK